MQQSEKLSVNSSFSKNSSAWPWSIKIGWGCLWSDFISSQASYCAYSDLSLKYPANAFVYPKVEATPYHSLETNPAKRIKYFEIEQKLHEEGFQIVAVRSEEYQETYSIEAGGERFVFDIWHNESGLFLSYLAHQQSESSEKLFSLIKKPVAWDYHYKYTAKNKMAGKLHQNILSSAQGLIIQIMGVDDSKMENYLITYYLRTLGDAYLQIYFKKNEAISSLIAKSTLGEDDTELKKLLENLVQ